MKILGTFTLRQLPDGRRNILATRGDNRESVVIPFSGTPAVDGPKLGGTMARFASDMTAPAPVKVPSLPKPRVQAPKPRPPQLRGPGTPLYASDAPKATGVPVSKLRPADGPIISGLPIKGRPNLPGVEEIVNDPRVDQIQKVMDQINAQNRPVTAPVPPAKLGNRSGRPMRDSMRVADIAKRAGITSKVFVEKAAELGVKTDNNRAVTHPNNIIRPSDVETVLTALGVKG